MKRHIKLIIKRSLLWLSVGVLTFGVYILSGQEGEVSHRLSSGVVKEAAEHMELPALIKNYIIKLGLDYEQILRKAAHFLLFLVLAVLLNSAIKSLFRKYTKILTIACCIFFAVMDECHQIFIAGRAARFTDVIIDSAGAITGFLLVTAAAGIWSMVNKAKRAGATHSIAPHKQNTP